MISYKDLKQQIQMSDLKDSSFVLLCVPRILIRISYGPASTLILGSLVTLTYKHLVILFIWIWTTTTYMISVVLAHSDTWSLAYKKLY